MWSHFQNTTPAEGGSRVFVHVSSFPRGQRPSAGCRVTYAEQRDERNRPRASEVRYSLAESRVPYSSAGPARRGSARGTRPAVAAAGVLLAVLVGLVVLGALPVAVVLVYGVLSGVAFLMYGADKSAAEQGRLRMTVEDDGPGIPPEQAREVLERGARADQATPGHGIGLAVAREICEAYGGGIEIGRGELGGASARVSIDA